MIYVFCPLHAEALPLIQALHLSKQDGPASFTCYGDKEKWFLTVCGCRRCHEYRDWSALQWRKDS